MPFRASTKKVGNTPSKRAVDSRPPLKTARNRMNFHSKESRTINTRANPCKLVPHILPTSTLTRCCNVPSRRNCWHTTCIMRRHVAFRMSNPVNQPVDLPVVSSSQGPVINHGPVADANQLSHLRARWKRVDRLTSENPLIQNPPRLYADRKLRSQICQLAIEVWPQYGPWQVSKAGNLWELRGQSPRPDQLPHLARADATLQGLYEKVRRSRRGQSNR
jgi:hypothetical protein